MSERIPCPSIRCDGYDCGTSDVGALLVEEMNERNWTTRDLAIDLDGGDEEELALDLLIHTNDPALVISEADGIRLDRAFGVSDGFFYRLHERWRAQEIARIARIGGGK